MLQQSHSNTPAAGLLCLVRLPQSFLKQHVRGIWFAPDHIIPITQNLTCCNTKKTSALNNQTQNDGQSTGCCGCMRLLLSALVVLGLAVQG
jgi:hypothetical protein